MFECILNNLTPHLRVNDKVNFFLVELPARVEDPCNA